MSPNDHVQSTPDLKLNIFIKILFLCVLLLSFPATAQVPSQPDPKIDSLENAIRIQKHDSSKVKILGDLAVMYKAKSDYNRAIQKASGAIELAQKWNLKKEESRALVIRGNTYNNIGKNTEALSDFLVALKLREKEGIKKDIASVYLGIGNTYSNMDNTEDALKYYDLALKLRQQINDKNGIAGIYMGIGNVYIAKNDLPKALDNYYACLKIKTESGDNKQAGDVWNNIGVVHEMMGDFQSALKDFGAALEISEAIGDKDAIAACYLNIAQVQAYLNNTKESQKYYDMGLALAKEVGDIEWLKQGYSGLSELDAMTGNYKKAYNDYQMYILYRDSISAQKNLKKITELQMQYDFDKKQEEEKLIQEKKDAETAAAAKTQTLIIAGVTIGLIVFLAFSVLLLKRIRLTRLQKQIIEEKNRDITDSINYAKRIQEVMLPPMEIKNRLFPESFVLFQPKDIVSGDFYWFAEKAGKRIIAAVDCTGHGVPGALMSMIGNAFLNEIVNEKGVTSPDQILNELRNMVIHSLKQTGAEGEARDGMDIAVLAFDDKNSIVEYAGANNPLWHIKESAEIEQYKADKRPIGYFRGEGLPFHAHKIAFKKGDSFYIFTDGFADQFGGPKGKKFKYSQLKELIISIQDRSMNEQGTILLNALNSWKNNLEQVDDVLVIGMKV